MVHTSAREALSINSEALAGWRNAACPSESLIVLVRVSLSGTLISFLWKPTTMAFELGIILPIGDERIN